MYALTETNAIDLETKGGVESQIRIDASIQSLSWMSKYSLVNVNSGDAASTTQPQQQTTTTTVANASSAPQSAPAPVATSAPPQVANSASLAAVFSRSNDHEKKFDKHLYYQEGWLATGNSNCMIGCTSTSIAYNRNSQSNHHHQSQHLNNNNKRNNNNNQKNSNNNNNNNGVGGVESNKSNEIANNNRPSTSAPATNSTSNNSSNSSSSSSNTRSNQPTTTTDLTNSNTNSNSSNSTSTTTTTTTTATSQRPNNQLNLNRTNFNQRGHKADIKLVRWNEPFQKLASCDSKGVIYVWVKHEGRWSIELINDRGFVVTDFAWSHDGRMAVICYKDGFVLVGSVNGQRFWSHLYELAASVYITSATWTPNDEFIVFALSNGSLMVVDENGIVVNRLSLTPSSNTTPPTTSNPSNPSPSSSTSSSSSSPSNPNPQAPLPTSQSSTSAASSASSSSTPPPADFSESIVSLAYNSPKFFIEEFIEAALKRAAAEATATTTATSQSSSSAAPAPTNTSNQPQQQQEANVNANPNPNPNDNAAAAVNNNMSSATADLISLSIINQNRLRFSLNNFYFSNNAALNRSESRLKNKVNNSNYLLACGLRSTGVIYLIRNFDLVDSIVIETKLKGIRFEWSNCGKILAVGGYIEINEPATTTPSEQSTHHKSSSHNKKTSEPEVDSSVENFIHFYDTNGKLIYKLKIPTTQKKEKRRQEENSSSGENEYKSVGALRVEMDRMSSINERFTALAWGHNDQRLFVACSNVLSVVRVYKRIPTLGLLSQLVVKSYLPSAGYARAFLLPEKVRHELAYLFSSTIKASLPKSAQMRRFVCMSNPNSERLHCTLKRINLNNNNDYFILYLEYLGGLIPLLSARKISNLKPDFVIFDPVINNTASRNNKKKMSSKKPLPSPATTTTTTTTKTTKKKPELEVDEDEEQKDLNYMKLKNSETATSFITMAANKSYLSSASLSTLGNLNTINNTVNNVNNSEDEEATAQEDGEVEEEELIDNNNNNANKQKKKAAKKSTKKQPTKRRFLFKLPNKKSQLAGTKKSKKKPDDYAVTKSVKKRAGKRTAPSTTTSIGTTKNSGEQLVNKSRTSTTSGENNILVSIKSNVWGTKFKFYGHKYLPELIGQIVYKTSLFHLQPRQMTITLEDLTYPTAAATNTVKPKEVVTTPNVSSNKPSSTKPTKTMKKVDSDNVSLLSKSIDVLSEYSASAGILAPASNGLKRRDSTYSSISSLIDPLAANSANKSRRELQKDVSLDETCSTARDLMLNKLTTIEIVDKQAQKPQLPVLTLAGENSIEVYYENCSMVDSPDDRQKLIISNTVGNDSADDTNRIYEEIKLVNEINVTKMPERTTISPNTTTTTATTTTTTTTTSMSRRLLNILNAESVISYIRKRKNFLKSNSLTYHQSNNNKDANRIIQEEDVIAESATTNTTTTATTNQQQTESTANTTPSTTTTTNETTSTTTPSEQQQSPIVETTNSTQKTKETKTNKANKATTTNTSSSIRRKMKKNSVADQTQTTPSRNRIVLHNKPPIWNENSQVYQLDFGGRVTQESAKNFQVEYGGKQVMQFGRIDTNAYTLDFEWPFTAIQAFSIALANITQRLK